MEKKIHYCWFGGKKLPSNVKKCIATWKKFLPDYEIIEWNENNFDLNTCPFVKEAYENKKWAMVSDYVRIYALYNQGGIYFDTDMKVIKDVSNVVNKNMFLGYEDSGYVGTAVIGVSEKNNKYMKEILDYYNNIEHFNVDIIYNYANPLIITKILKKYESKFNEEGINIIDNNVYIYPRDYFFPLSYNYAEKVYTKNTCMVHLFNATWTDKKERREINLYRKLGTRFGRYANNFINSFGKFTFGCKKIMLAIYRKIKMKISVHLNIDKRVNDIKKQLEKTNGKTIVIVNPDHKDEIDNSLELFDNINIFIRQQYTQKEAEKITEAIIEANKEIVIFNSYSSGWDRIICKLKDLKSNIKIKLILNESNDKWVGEEDSAWEVFNKSVDLYNKRKIDCFGVFNENDYQFLQNKDINVELLRKNILINKNIKTEERKEKEEKEENEIQEETKNSTLKIGLYKGDDEQIANVYNQLAAASLIEDSVIDCEQIGYKISMFARYFNANISGITSKMSIEDIYKKMASNDINLFVRLIDDFDALPVKSLELGTICLTGKCKFFEGTELENYLVVKDPNDIKEIYNKIKSALENKEAILDLYKNKYRKIYIEDFEQYKEKFINT